MIAHIRSTFAARLLRLSVVALVACNAIAGIGVPILETTDGSTTPSGTDAGHALDASGAQPDGNAGTDGATGSEDGGMAADDGGGDTSATDANLPDTFTPPPPAAKPGFDLSAGGTYGASASFKLIAVAGESPGGNNVGKSKSFTLKAGVIAVTQPN